MSTDGFRSDCCEPDFPTPFPRRKGIPAQNPDAANFVRHKVADRAVAVDIQNLEASRWHCAKIGGRKRRRWLPLHHLVEHLVQTAVHAAFFDDFLFVALELLWTRLLVADGHHQVGDKRKLIKRDVEATRLVRQLFVELGRVFAAQTLHAVDRNLHAGQLIDLGPPVELLRIVRWTVWDIIADQHQTLAGVRQPRKTLRFVKHQLVALWKIATARRFDVLHKRADRVGVIGQIEPLGDVGAAFVAVVAVRNDSDPHVRDVLHKARHRFFDLAANLGKTRIHATGGVEAEHHQGRPFPTEPAGP